MKLKFIISLVALSLASFNSFSKELKNDVYKLTIKKNGVEVERDGGRYLFTGDFVIISADKNPKAAIKTTRPIRYSVISWEAKGVPANKVLVEAGARKHVGGDGIDVTGDVSKERRTFDLFYSGKNTFVSPSKISVKKNIVSFVYPSNDSWDLYATIELPQGKAEPLLTYSFKAKTPAYYSVGYMGAPAFNFGDLTEIFQPLIWTQKRVPDLSYLTMAYHCPIPGTLVEDKGYTVGVVVNPDDFPFQPMPTRDNNLFGVALRDNQDKARSMLFTPVLGQQKSQMKEGDEVKISALLYIRKKGLVDAFQDIAENNFGFYDYRQNSFTTINQTLDNELDYGLSKYSQFIDSLKGTSYSTDVPGSVKNVSSLNPLGIALITDNESWYWKRANPILEYLISRENTLFCLDTTQKVQNPSRKLNGPSATMSELANLYAVSLQSSPVMLKMAEDLFYKGKPEEEREIGRGQWDKALPMYQATGDERYLKWAKLTADKYIEDFASKPDEKMRNMFFWTSFVPKFAYLYEMFEVTGERKYLEVAHKAARWFTLHMWFSPRIPNDSIVVNKDGKAPMYWYLEQKGHKQQYVPEEKVPAWRLSETALTCEAAGTSIGHRGIFMMCPAPYLLRIAHHTNDDFLRSVARSQIIGRYSNFPGYHMNTARTTVYEKPDFPLRNHEEISSGSMHYNHIYPHMTLLIDFLVSDVYDRSQRAVDFPSLIIEGYAYLTNRFYGHKPGKFYSYNNVFLYMPQHLLSTSNIELNYVSARDNNNLYVAFTNQVDKIVKSSIVINPETLPQVKDHTYDVELWKDNKKVGNIKLVDGKCDIEVSPKGITAIVIKDIKVITKLQQKMTSLTPEYAWQNDYLDMEFGNASAMILNIGVGLRNAYVYLRDDDSKFSSASIEYVDSGGGKRVLTDSSYPFEFSIPIEDESQSEFVFTLSGVDVNGNKVTGTQQRLSK